MKLVLATRNRGKIEEFRRALEPLGVELRSALDTDLGPAPEESGSSYEENALIKAAHATHVTGLVALADDSGLEVDALGGGPGIYSARFGGRLSEGERIAHLLQKMKNVPEGERSAKFRCVLVLAGPNGRVRSFEGSCEGRILPGPRGERGHGYDPVFWSPDLGKTFAEATTEEKEAVSHRGQAVASLLEWAKDGLAGFVDEERAAD
ncbi:MAG TPA: RdgB/HAM1 family non-canonical purine NTP pyrophosphatase [Trueperaceae bacterium]